MRLPWRRARPETRADYTEAAEAALWARAYMGLHGDGLAVVEAAVGLISRAFASADVRGVADPRVAAALTPEILAWIARQALTRGEAVAAVAVDGGRVALHPAAAHDVHGQGQDPASWRYRLDLASPDGQRTAILPAEAVLHVRYSCDAATPWRGVGPLGRAGVSAAVAALAEAALRSEMSVPVGRIVPIPSGAAATPTEDGETLADKIRADMQKLAGGVMLPETMQTGFGAGRADAPARDWRAETLQPAPASGMIEARQALTVGLAGALGVPAVLLIGGQGGSDSGQREAWRRCLHGSIAPLGKLAAAELGRALDAPGLALDFAALAASDIAGRARAFGSLVTAGMSLADAAAASGVLQEENA
ncbi:MAG: phage portal protein [Rhodospirillaceae bacterium]|nr:phage portal protein [Rhodospirillaceae bacterium]